MSECDCPDGYIKCGWMNYCIQENLIEDMCPFSLPVNCKKYPGFTKKGKDDICRSSKDFQPSHRVCPIGYVLCPDLTCKPEHSQCSIYPACSDNEVQCVDQSCGADQRKCPTTITCTNPSQVVCPDGTCIDNEIKCSALPKCTDLLRFYVATMLALQAILSVLSQFPMVILSRYVMI